MNVGSEGPARILVVDKHPVIRVGLRQLIEQESDLSVCGEADTIERALDAAVVFDPDLIIVDLALGAEDGVELIRHLRARYSAVRLLVFSVHDEALFAYLALQAGANGYVVKGEPSDHVVHAIREVLAGRTYVSERLR